MERVARVIEFRDETVSSHVIRVGRFSRVVTEAMGYPPEFCARMEMAAPFHDLGNVGIPDMILLKPHTLTSREREMMRQHCLIGATLLSARELSELRESAASEAASLERPICELAALICLCHHERMDGSGYPDGLEGDAIPLEARIVAVVDVFDSLMSSRRHREPYSEEVALGLIEQAAGKGFDPAVCQAFLTSLPRLREIREELPEPQADSEEMLLV